MPLDAILRLRGGTTIEAWVTRGRRAPTFGTSAALANGPQRPALPAVGAVRGARAYRGLNPAVATIQFRAEL